MAAGRPTLATADNAEKVAGYIRAGNPRTRACALVGISKSTLMAWQKKAKRMRRGPIVDFLDRIERAEAEVVQLHTANITLAARGRAGSLGNPATGQLPTAPVEADWKASAWLLERLDRKHFAKTITTKHKVDAGKGKTGGVAFFTLDIPSPGQPQGAAAAEADDE